MEERLITAAIVVFGVPAALVGYILLTERLIATLPEQRQGRIRPWFWIAPALAFLIVFLIYPTINTLALSFQDKVSKSFVGLDNYIWFFGDAGTLEALRNSVLWVIFMTAGVVALGLLVAILVDRVRYESVAKTAIFIPLAISFVAAAIIWQFMYQYRPPGTEQVGTVNAAVGLVGERLALVPGAHEQLPHQAEVDEDHPGQEEEQQGRHDDRRDERDDVVPSQPAARHAQGEEDGDDRPVEQRETPEEYAPADRAEQPLGEEQQAADREQEREHDQRTERDTAEEGDLADLLADLAELGLREVDVRREQPLDRSADRAELAAQPHWLVLGARGGALGGSGGLGVVHRVSSLRSCRSGVPR